MFYKRFFTKFLPVLCFVFMLFLYLNQEMAKYSSENLVETIQKMKRLQIMDVSKQYLKLNASMAENSSNEGTDKLVIETRNWFDHRPKVLSSSISYSKHPYFQGFHIENSDLCDGEAVDVLIYIHSAPEHREERLAIRETWGNPLVFSHIKVKLVFVLGLSMDKLRQLQVETEYSTYGDIVQGKFVDTFSNLTHKAVIMLAWVNAHCPTAKYIIKVDDDMFVDIYSVIQELIPKMTNKTFAAACDYKVNMVIQRNPTNRWYVPNNLVQGKTHWPAFCSGYFAMFTGSMIPKLYEASFTNTDFVSVDDAYLFGLLPEKTLKFDVVNIHGQVTPNENPKAHEKVFSLRKFQHLAFRSPTANEHRKLWSLRGMVLSSWEKAHSNFYVLFQRANETGIIIV